ncbi:MAG: ribonuclease R, partial [Myxococcaceae bacterium]
RGRAAPEKGRARTVPSKQPAGRVSGEGLVDGILHVHRDGYGFVHPLTGGGENIYVPSEEVQLALDGDRVLVEVVKGRGGRTAGVVLDVLERRRQRVVGVYRQEGRRNAWVTPNDKSLQGDIRVPPTQLARDGDLVKVVLGIGASVIEPGVALFGEVMGVIGQPGSPSGEVLSIAYANGFSDEFPEEVMADADRYALAVTPEEAVDEERRDLRQLPLVTIDGEDARDFDDAVYVEPTPGGGWRLVVAIADVTHYVREDMALDAEALHRATSVYLPDRVLPMLPERLSNGICSLRPEEDRLCMVADMVFDRGARLRSYELYPGVMRSVARCTYNEVQDVLDGKDVPHRNLFRPQFENLMALARALHDMRLQRGAIDFDLPEYKVIIGEDGLPARMERRERKDSHRLIEECMLAANEAVARFFQENELPCVYRYHGEPDEEKLQIFAALAQAHGFKLGARGEISSFELNQFLEQLEGHRERRALNQLLLRSMMQAVYSAENVGHYGLAAEYYLHFTSPIRRYPDLIVHRLLKAHWRRGGKVPPLHACEVETERLEAMAAQSSERERAAVSVEREVVSYYSTLLMKDRVGEEFDGTVAGIADFGFFVELEEVFVEGLVRAETLGPGMRMDTLSHSLVWPHGKRIRVGDKARVRLVAANLERRQLELEAVSFPGEAALERPRRAE